MTSMIKQLCNKLFSSEHCRSLMMETKEGAELCFPQLFNSSCRKSTLLWSEAVIVNVASFISVVTVILNLLIIISIFHFRQLHTPTNIILLSLAFSDFFVGLLLMPMEISRYKSCWLLGDIICLVYSYLIAHIVTASIGNIVLISVDRYVAICDPLHYPNRFSVVKVNCCVCLCWLWCFFFSIFYLKDDLLQPGRSNTCIGECIVVVSYIVQLVDLILNFIVPVTVIVILYMRVFVVAVAQAHVIRSHVTAVTFQLSMNFKKAKTVTKKSELKAARSLGILVCVYLICYCPFYCFSLVDLSLPNTPSALILFFLFYFNSCLNPVIYALLYPWFRKAIKLIVTLQILKPGSREANIISRNC